MVLSVGMSEPRPALFPARVTFPDGTSWHPVRVATGADGMTRAWRWDHGNQSPVEIGTWPATELARADGVDHGRPRAYTTSDGTVIDNRGAGCGCGHPLKGWRPPALAA